MTGNLIDVLKQDTNIREIAGLFPDARITKLNGIDQNITVADLVDDLHLIYTKDNTKEARELRETKRKNTAYVNALSKQKHLKI